MQRHEAVSRAAKFLGNKGQINTKSVAKDIKEESKDNPTLNRRKLNHVIADIYQRGARPKDLDLKRIDWSASYNNIRGQVERLLDKRGNEGFEVQKKADRETDMSYAAKKESEMLKDIAQVRHERRDPHAQYTDETKEAERKFGRLTDSAYQKWSRNPNKYDIEGVDGKQDKGSQKPLPLQRSEKIFDMRMKDAEQDTSDPAEAPMGAGVNPKKLMDSKKLGISDSNNDVSSNFSDSRASKNVEKNLKGNSSERSSQQSLRDGFASKSSEKTLDKWEDNYV